MLGVAAVLLFTARMLLFTVMVLRCTVAVLLCTLACKCAGMETELRQPLAALCACSGAGAMQLWQSSLAENMGASALQRWASACPSYCLTPVSLLPKRLPVIRYEYYTLVWPAGTAVWGVAGLCTGGWAA